MKKLKSWTPAIKRILMGYNHSGFTLLEVSGFMYNTTEPTKEQITRVKNQMSLLQVNLRKVKAV